MNDDRPKGPDPTFPHGTGQTRTFPPNPQDPSRVKLGFPTGAVENLRRWRNRERYLTGDVARVLVDDLDEVLAWIARFVPLASACDVGHEIEVGGVGILTIESDEPFAASVELIRFNGRTFVEETARIVEEDELIDGEHDETLLARAALTLSIVYREGFESLPSDPDPRDVFEAIGRRIGAESASVLRSLAARPLMSEDDSTLGALCDEVVSPCPVRGCVRDDEDHAAAFERRPAVEGLECVKALGPAYERDAGGRPVHVGADEPTDAEGRFPGDDGYRRPE